MKKSSSGGEVILKNSNELPFDDFPKLLRFRFIITNVKFSTLSVFLSHTQTLCSVPFILTNHFPFSYVIVFTFFVSCQLLLKGRCWKVDHIRKKHISFHIFFSDCALYSEKVRNYKWLRLDRLCNLLVHDLSPYHFTNQSFLPLFSSTWWI